MTLNLFDLFTTNGKRRTEELEYTEDTFNLTHTTYPVVSKSPIKLEFISFEPGKIRVSGNFSVELLIPCDRCLKSVNTKIDCEFDNVLFSDDLIDKSDDYDETSFLQNNEFDVIEFVNMYVLMNMPSKILCKESCKGLCPVCGNDLNENECGCDTFVPDPRMAKIKDIFYGNKEV